MQLVCCNKWKKSSNMKLKVDLNSGLGDINKTFTYIYFSKSYSHWTSQPWLNSLYMLLSESIKMEFMVHLLLYKTKNRLGNTSTLIPLWCLNHSIHSGTYIGLMLVLYSNTPTNNSNMIIDWSVWGIYRSASVLYSNTNSNIILDWSVWGINRSTSILYNNTKTQQQHNNRLICLRNI